MAVCSGIDAGRWMSISEETHLPHKVVESHDWPREVKWWVQGIGHKIRERVN